MHLPDPGMPATPIGMRCLRLIYFARGYEEARLWSCPILLLSRLNARTLIEVMKKGVHSNKASIASPIKRAL